METQIPNRSDPTQVNAALLATFKFKSERMNFSALFNNCILAGIAKPRLHCMDIYTHRDSQNTTHNAPKTGRKGNCVCCLAVCVEFVPAVCACCEPRCADVPYYTRHRNIWAGTEIATRPNFLNRRDQNRSKTCEMRFRSALVSSKSDAY